MKINLKVNENIQHVGFVLLMLAFVFASVGATSASNVEQRSTSQAAIAKYAAVQQNLSLNDEEKIKAVIDTYFTTRYEGQKLLEAQDFSPLIEDNTLDWVKKEKDKRDIELYIAKLFDLKYISYDYTLDYDSIEVKNNKATVQLRESNQVVYEATAPQTSGLANLQHTFTLHNKNGSWVIYKDEYQDELSLQLDQMTKADILKQVDKNYQDQENRISTKLNDRSTLEPMILTTLNRYAYSGSGASSYADQYAYSTNTTYGRYTQDCTNFVSQAIYQGQGFYVPPANTGGMGPWGDDTQWYFDFPTKTGTSPWINVPAQYDFVIGNTNKIGPYGNGSSNYLCYVQPGDVVQIQNGTGNPWFHEGMIVAVNGPCTSLSNYLFDAHTTDYKRQPLSLWANYNMRYLLIYGWFGN